MNNLISNVKSLIERRAMLLIMAFVMLCWLHLFFYLDPILIVCIIAISAFSMLGFASYRLVKFFSARKSHANAARQG